MSDPVKVHWNLHRLCWSITRKGRPVQHAASFRLSGCTFVVQPGGRARAAREKRRHVHAYVKGTPTQAEWQGALTRVRYNPFRAAYFHTEAGVPVAAAVFVLFDEQGRAWASGLETQRSV